MLPAAARLRHRDEFADVLRRGRRVSRGPLVLHWGRPRPRDHSDVGVVRVGFVISAKVGDAVRRNLLRRRLRHLLRDRLATLPSGDLVVRALPGAAELGYDELDRLVSDGLRSLGRP